MQRTLKSLTLPPALRRLRMRPSSADTSGKDVSTGFVVIAMVKPGALSAGTMRVTPSQLPMPLSTFQVLGLSPPCACKEGKLTVDNHEN